MNQASTTTLGRTLKDTYRIDHYLGEGGPSIVYKGTDILLDVPVAIKRLKSGLPLSSGHTTAQRFLREARTQARLHHQNIVGIRAMLEEGEDTFIVMEFVEGVDLHEYIGLFPDFRLPLNELHPIFGQALTGLGFAHKHNVVHRDIKPSNILMGDGLIVKLADFGIARAVNDHKLTQTGSLLGTLLYISPEQLRGEPADHRSDIYSMGISLYEAVVGHTPFARSQEEIHNGYELLSRHLFTPPEPPIHFRPELPSALNDVILQSIAKTPDQRFQDCQSFAQALQESLHGITPTTRWARALERAPLQPVQKVHTPDPAPPDPLATPPQQRGTQTVHPIEVSDPLAMPPKKRGTQTVHPLEPADLSSKEKPGTAALSPAMENFAQGLDPLDSPIPSGDDLPSLPPSQKGTQTLTPRPLHISPDKETPIQDTPAPQSTSTSSFVMAHTYDQPLSSIASQYEMNTILDDQLSADDLRLMMTPKPPTSSSQNQPNADAHPIEEEKEIIAHHPSPSSMRIAQASALSTREMEQISNTLRDDNGLSPLQKTKPKRSSAPLFLFGVVFLLLAGGGGWWYLSQTLQTSIPLQVPTSQQPLERKRSTPPPSIRPLTPHPNPATRHEPQPTPQPRLRRDTAPPQEAPMGMLWIPKGWFWQGKERKLQRRKRRQGAHHPLRKVFIQGFWLDQYEVTVGAYKECVQSKNCKEIHIPFTAKGRSTRKKQPLTQTFPPEEPMRFVRWEEAFRYCRWRQKRLPTEAEWEYAARGAEKQPDAQRMYAWKGQRLTCRHAVYKGCAKHPLPASTERLQGQSPFGVMDMIGNVWEWVQDCYHVDASTYTPPTNPIYDFPNCKRRVLRGGSFRSGSLPYELTLYHRRHTLTKTRRDENGFRCASSKLR